MEHAVTKHWPLETTFVPQTVWSLCCSVISEISWMLQTTLNKPLFLHSSYNAADIETLDLKAGADLLAWFLQF